jgi:hypothetical protein
MKECEPDGRNMANCPNDPFSNNLSPVIVVLLQGIYVSLGSGVFVAVLEGNGVSEGIGVEDGTGVFVAVSAGNGVLVWVGGIGGVADGNCGGVAVAGIGGVDVAAAIGKEVEVAFGEGEIVGLGEFVSVGRGVGVEDGVAEGKGVKVLRGVVAVVIGGKYRKRPAKIVVFSRQFPCIISRTVVRWRRAREPKVSPCLTIYRAQVRGGPHWGSSGVKGGTNSIIPVNNRLV